MAESAIRNFRVGGQIRSMFTPDGGSPAPSYIQGMLVELWQKGPAQILFLGSGITAADGTYTIDFECESPSSMIVDGVISNVFMKVYYNNQIIVGDLDPDAGSFD